MSANVQTVPAAAEAFDHYPYSIKRHGLTLANCDSEPVQTPGCVQAHGALLVLRLPDLCILQASDNADAVLGQPAERLLGQGVRAVLGLDGEARLRELLDREPTERNPLYLQTLLAGRVLQMLPPGSIAGEASGNGNGNGNGTARALDVMVHTLDGVALLEFEATGRTDLGNPDYYALVKKTVAGLQTASSLQLFCDSVAREIRDLTGLDRVMIHKFHADGHGEVFAESRRPDLASWIGMHFPADDIPQPARALFTKTWIRPVPDVSDPLAEMLPLLNPETQSPLDMTFCALRGVSVMYAEYLRNMGVAATLTLAIRRGDTLWGLIACHHYAGPKHVPYQVRAACEFLAQVVSLQHQAAEDKEHMAYRIRLDDVHRQLVAAAAEGGGLASLTSGEPTMLDGIDAGGAALFHLDRWWCVGNTPSEDQLEGLAQWLVAERFGAGRTPLYATDSLVRDYPDAASFSAVASGLLALPIAHSGRNLMLWFRPETQQTIHWRGDPHYQPLVLGPNGPRLTPRGSFDLFVESVRLRAEPWLQVELDAAAGLRLVLIEMVVNRAARLAVLHADLARSNEELEAFAYVASHDLKEPLRGITQYARQLRGDDALAGEASRVKLDRLMQLTARMDGLLDSLLHFSHIGRAELAFELVDPNAVLAEAAAMARSRTLSLDITCARPLPMLRCQRLWLREVFVNLLSNALTFSDKPRKQVEVGYIDAAEAHPRPGCPPGSERHTIFYVADNGIGIEARHFNQVFKLFKRLHARDEYGAGAGAGLTIVRKLIERHGGRVWLDSTPGKGATFYFTLSGQDTDGNPRTP